MTADVDEPVLYAEPGSTWWPVLWGPVFAVTGAIVEVVTGPVHWLAWLVLAALLAALTAGWVKARRRVCSLSLTERTLRQGQEELPVDRIVAVIDGEDALGRPLGGGLTVPRKTYEIPLELDDGTTVLAWARDGAALRAALTPLVGATPPI
ncbi:hypothetical protein [Actinokineospora xionganensis]|uniref:DUF3093 family protein n=1 Tax=Actinokineospora xionganensis TaxID=2684470 RepID=A0ABR7L272_9PSEU|nr:hypothetical protein [Actinokineospora xionganensis]MBC6446496.1 hypothetical protein [Actinokineospora xionganensis]